MAQYEDKVLHELDGIKEYDNPMPGWLMAIWWGSILFAAAYLVFYALAFGEGSMEAEYRAETDRALAAIQISGAALFSSSLAVAAESGGAAVAIGGLRAAGDLGFFAGTALSVLALQSLGREPRYEDYTAIISGFGALHLLTTGLLAALALTAARRAGRTAP